MQAFVYTVGKDGKDRLGTGRVSPSYTHFGNFMRHWMRKLPPGTYRAYIYESYSHLRGKPDEVKTITVNNVEK